MHICDTVVVSLFLLGFFTNFILFCALFLYSVRVSGTVVLYSYFGFGDFYLLLLLLVL